jgi:hypothetical protein
MLPIPHPFGMLINIDGFPIPTRWRRSWRRERAGKQAICSGFEEELCWGRVLKDRPLRVRTTSSLTISDNQLLLAKEVLLGLRCNYPRANLEFAV